MPRSHCSAAAAATAAQRHKLARTDSGGPAATEPLRATESGGMRRGAGPRLQRQPGLRPASAYEEGAEARLWRQPRGGGETVGCRHQSSRTDGPLSGACGALSGKADD